MAIALLSVLGAGLTNSSRVMAQDESEYSPLYRSWRTLVIANGENGRKGLKDADGNWVLWSRYDDLRPFLNHKLPADSSLYVFLRRSEDPADPAGYASSLRGLDNIIVNMPALPVKIDGLWHVYFFRIDGSFHDYGPFPEGLIPCGDYWGITPSGYINPDGEWVIERRFAYVEQFSEGLALVGLKDQNAPPASRIEWRQHLLYGYINTSGEMVIAPRRYRVTPGMFSDGLARVYIQDEDENPGGYGYINREGELAIRPRYEMAGEFYRGLACVLYRDTFWYNCFLPLNNCLGGLALVLSGRIGGGPAFDIDQPQIFAVLNSRGREVYSTKEGRDGVFEYIRLHDPEWFE